MFEFDNDAKEKNFSSKLALVELLCLWFCTRSHFYSLKTTVCLRSNFAKWKYMRPGELYKLERIMILETVRAHLIQIKIIILLKANITYVNQHYDELKRCEGRSNQKSLVCLLWKGQWAREVVAVHLWRKSATSLTNTQLLHAPILMILLGFSFSFSCICVWVCNIPPLFETGQIVKAKAIAFHFDGNIWLMSS